MQSLCLIFGSSDHCPSDIEAQSDAYTTASKLVPLNQHFKSMFHVWVVFIFLELLKLRLHLMILYRKVYALDVVGVIPDELWNLTFLTNLYEFISHLFVACSYGCAFLSLHFL